MTYIKNIGLLALVSPVQIGREMKSFDQFFLMNTEDVKRYAVDVLHRFLPDEETVCTEIGDGNINYVYKVVSKIDGHSVIIKQADKLNLRFRNTYLHGPSSPKAGQSFPA